MTDHTQRLPCACSQIAASFHTDRSGHDTSGLTQQADSILLNTRTWQARHQNTKTPTSIGKLHFLACPGSAKLPPSQSSHACAENRTITQRDGPSAGRRALDENLNAVALHVGGQPALQVRLPEAP